MERADDMEALPSWFQRAWKQLRSALFIGTVAAGLVMGALKAYRDAFPPTVPVTAEQISSSTDELREDFKGIADSTVRSAIDSVQGVNDSLFTAMVRDVVEPGIRRQNALMREVKRLNELMGLSNAMLEEQGERTQRTNDKLDEMRGLMNTNDKEELLQMLRAIQQDNDAIKRKLKIQSPQRF